MNIKQFYTEQKKKEEEHFFQQTGLKTRQSVQNYDEGTDIDDVFILKLPKHREYLGIETHGCIFYMFPVNGEETMLLIYDNSLMNLYRIWQGWSAERFEVFGKYMPSFMQALDNAETASFSDIVILLDEDRFCFAKQFNYPLFDNISEDGFLGLEVLEELTSLIQFRNQCIDEMSTFNGFTPKEERVISLKECLGTAKSVLRVINLTNRFSDNN